MSPLEWVAGLMVLIAYGSIAWFVWDLWIHRGD